MSTFMPRYDMTNIASVWRKFEEDWQPVITPEDILLRAVPTPHAAYSTKPNKSKNTFAPLATEEEAFRQFGRAVAMLPYWEYVGIEGAWHIIKHKHSDKMIRVSITKNAAFVEEKRSGIGVWKTHQIQQVYTILEDEGKKIIFGGDYRDNKHWTENYKARVFKSNNGIWGAEFAPNTMPYEVESLKDRQYITKYHFLAKMLQAGGNVSLRRPSHISSDSAKFFFIDGYKRELWRIAGYDYKDIPMPATEPVEEPVDEYYNQSDHIINAIESGAMDYSPVHNDDFVGIGNAVRACHVADLAMSTLVESGLINDGEYAVMWNKIYEQRLIQENERDGKITA